MTHGVRERRRKKDKWGLEKIGSTVVSCYWCFHHSSGDYFKRLLYSVDSDSLHNSLSVEFETGMKEIIDFLQCGRLRLWQVWTWIRTAMPGSEMHGSAAAPPKTPQCLGGVWVLISRKKVWATLYLHNTPIQGAAPGMPERFSWREPGCGCDLRNAEAFV